LFAVCLVMPLPAAQDQSLVALEGLTAPAT
jgi:hypothetical protein